MREIKEINQRMVDPEKRINRLTALAHEHGPEKLEDEIGVHIRKIIDLEMALEVYRKETN